MKFKNVHFIPLLLIFLIIIFYEKIVDFFSNKNVVLPSVIKLPDSNSTLTNTESKNIANSLYTAMAGFGTDEDIIYQLLETLTVHDFNKVFNSFKIRWYNTTLGTESTNVAGSRLNLIQWMQEELSSSDFKEYSKRFNFYSD